MVDQPQTTPADRWEAVMKSKATPKGWQVAPNLGRFNPGELKTIAEAVHYPDCWDTAAYPTLAEAIYEIVTNAGCSECSKKP